MAEDILKVGEVMRTDLHEIGGLDSIADALLKMRRHSVSSLVIAVNKSLNRTSVYEIMDKPILTVDPDMLVKYAVRLLSQLGRRRALVRGETGIDGFVSLRDLVLSYGEVLLSRESGGDAG